MMGGEEITRPLTEALAELQAQFSTMKPEERTAVNRVLQENVTHFRCARARLAALVSGRARAARAQAKRAAKGE